MRLFSSIAALSLATIGAPALAEDEYKFETERVHSELPLYTFEWGDVWPRSFQSGEGEPISFGCVSRVGHGDWEFTPNPDDEFGEPFWLRIGNYGVFHCAANLWTADTRSELDEGYLSRGLFAKIGKTQHSDKAWELWVLQEGFVPGSDYLLLAREADKEGALDSFSVLQRRCPTKNIREAEGMDVWSTRYCLINSREELLAFAKKMLAEPLLGTVARADNEEGSDANTPDPSE